MINLEELTLFLLVRRNNSTFIDGIQINDQILIHLPRLNKFTFNIQTYVSFNENIEINLPSKDNIKRSFNERKFSEVDSMVHILPMHGYGQSHVYSLPYQFEDFFGLNNSFQGDIFSSIRCITLTDSLPFEHKFFQIISQSFPLLEDLDISNSQSQNEKKDTFPLLKFPHLNHLTLDESHLDYIELFLFDKNAYLPCLNTLCINYELLVIVTENFTNDAARLHCAKIRKLYTDGTLLWLEIVERYFPLL